MSIIKSVIAKQRALDEAAAIHVKKGAFHAWLGKSPDAKITAADIAKGKAAGGHAAKMATFAQNFGHVHEAYTGFHHGDRVKLKNQTGTPGAIDASHHESGEGDKATYIHRVKHDSGETSWYHQDKLIKEETIAEEHKILDVSKDEYGNRFELHAHNVGHKSEWHGIHKTHQGGEKLSGGGTSTIGQPKYVAKKWKQMKADHRNPNISYPGVPKMGQVKEETLEESKALLKKFRHNENENYHAENSLLLAKHFGTKDEHEAMQRHVAAVHGKPGQLAFTTASAIQSKYFHHLAKFEGVIESDEVIAEAGNNPHHDAAGAHAQSKAARRQRIFKKKQKVVREGVLVEIKAGMLHDHPWVGKKVRYAHEGAMHDGVVKRVERAHTFSQMVPFITKLHITHSSGAEHYVNKDSARRVKEVSEELKVFTGKPNYGAGPGKGFGGKVGALYQRNVKRAAKQAAADKKHQAAQKKAGLY